MYHSAIIFRFLPPLEALEALEALKAWFKQRERDGGRIMKRDRKTNNFLNNLFYIRSSGAEDKRKEICLRLASSSRYE